VIQYDEIDSPVGWLTLGVTADGKGAGELAYCLFGRGTGPRQEMASRSACQPVLAAGVADAAASQLADYFAGARHSFDLDLAPAARRNSVGGTDFQRAAWQGLLSIPYGETISYGDLARRIGRPRAFRAVGQANHRNPISIIIPCHRVIGADGSLTGFGGGMKIKRALLALERAQERQLA